MAYFTNLIRLGKLIMLNYALIFTKIMTGAVIKSGWRFDCDGNLFWLNVLGYIQGV